MAGLSKQWGLVFPLACLTKQRQAGYPLKQDTTNQAIKASNQATKQPKQPSNQSNQPSNQATKPTKRPAKQSSKQASNQPAHPANQPTGGTRPTFGHSQVGDGDGRCCSGLGPAKALLGSNSFCRGPPKIGGGASREARGWRVVSQLFKADLLTFWFSHFGPYLVMAPKG